MKTYEKLTKTPPNRESLVFVTGNAAKFAEAQKVAQHYNVTLQRQALDIIEIQSNNPVAVSQAKAKSAYQMINRPLITHDSSWSIPALNGFPGAYMHDIVRWFSSEDWLNLMRSHSNKIIEVCENVTYYDDKGFKCFQYRQQGTFVDTPRGENGNSLEKVVILSGDQTIAEHHDAGIENNSVVLKVWEDFFRWYTENVSVPNKNTFCNTPQKIS